MSKRMTVAEARAAVEAANAALCLAAQLVKDHRPLLEAFFEEKRRMESVGPILDPTLFKSRERQAVVDLLSPVYQAALDFLKAHEVAQEQPHG